MNASLVTSTPYFHFVRYSGLSAGSRVIILGAVHGNEVCGTQAIRRIMAEIDSGAVKIASGSVTFVPVTNPLAYARNQRMGDRNLNRNLYPNATPVDFEDHVANWLSPLLAEHDVLLDLHSFHTPGEAFAMLGPANNTGALEPFSHADAERHLALHLGVTRFVDGWLDTYARGVERRLNDMRNKIDRPNFAYTARSEVDMKAASYAINTDARYGVGTTEYMRSVGGYGITLECGQHDDPLAPQRGYLAILNALKLLGIIEAPMPMAVVNPEKYRINEVIDREHPQDCLVSEWASFDRLTTGQLIGTRYDGRAIYAQSDGVILFPNPKALPGQEWFYLARSIHTF
jgi:uncharacterized protein